MTTSDSLPINLKYEFLFNFKKSSLYNICNFILIKGIIIYIIVMYIISILYIW